MSDIYKFILETLVASCGVSAGDVQPDTNLFTELGVNSVDFLDAVYAIDRAYDIRLPVAQWMSEVNEGSSATAHRFMMQNLVDAVTELARARKAVSA